MSELRLTPAIELAQKKLTEAKKELRFIPNHYNGPGSMEDVHMLRRSIEGLADVLDLIIRSGHFMEPESKEGNHKI